MKKIVVFVLFLVLCFSFVFAVEPDAGIGGEDVEAIQEGIDTFSPLDDSGEINLSKYEPIKSKAEQRVEAINVYVGPITRVLWGVELEVSWVFIFALVMWLLLIEVILVPVKEIFDFNFWGAFVFSGIVATLAMQGFGKDFVVWMNSLMTQWWIGIVVVGGAIIMGVVYSLVFKSIGAMAKKAKEKDEKDRTERDRKILHVEAKLIRDSFK